jgi:16S rRNA (cytosine967-C5)-methyltransferase
LTSRTADPRLAAHRILEETESGRFADRVADTHLNGLDPRDRGLALELAYGCLRLRARLDTELRRLVDRPLHRLESAVLQWLRLGLYQLRETRIPDHAAVHATVTGAHRTVGRRASGLVNAVLRSAAATSAAEAAAVFPSRDEDPVGNLSSYGSHPEWLVRRWLERWSREEVFRLVELDNTPPCVTVRLAQQTTPEAVVRDSGESIRLDPLPEWPGSYTLAAGTPAQLLGAADVVVQDPAASAVVEYAVPDAIGPLLDACAAPGGKSVGLAWCCGARPLIAADISAERLRKVGQAADRLELDLCLVAMDARNPAVRCARTVLLDAPCTGTGVLRRRPDARWRASPDRLRDLVRLQGELLDACAEVVEPGGLLVYATCSLEQEENELQIEAFLERIERFERERPDAELRLPSGVLTSQGDLLVKPWQFGTDGAYAARLRRVA